MLPKLSREGGAVNGGDGCDITFLAVTAAAAALSAAALSAAALSAIGLPAIGELAAEIIGLEPALVEGELALAELV